MIRVGGRFEIIGKIYTQSSVMFDQHKNLRFDTNAKGSLQSSKSGPVHASEWMRSEKDVEYELGDGCEKAYHCKSDIQCESDSCCDWVRTNMNDRNGSQSNCYGCEGLIRCECKPLHNDKWMRTSAGCESLLDVNNATWMRTTCWFRTTIALKFRNQMGLHG